MERRTRGAALGGQLVLHLSGVAGGAVAALAGIPLPWIVGSMFAAGLLAMLWDVAPAPAASRISGQLLIGATLGLAMTPQAVAAIAVALHLAVAAALATIALGIAIGLLLMRFTALDLPTAIFSSIPGGPAEMAQFSSRHGGDPSYVALAQTLRIITIILAFPVLMSIGTAADFNLAPHVEQFDLVPFLMLIGTAAAGAVLASVCRIASPAFVGAMAMVGAMVGTNLLHAAMPEALVVLAQILIGVAIGSGCRRSLLKSAGRSIAQISAGTMVLLAGCLVVAAIIAKSTPFDLRTMALANAPGSMPEMAMTARAVDLDFSLVTAFHLVRVLVVMISLPLIYRWIASRFAP